MAATRTVVIDELLEIDMEGLDLGGVHFTDELFDFDIVVTNRSDERLTGVIEFASELETTLGMDRDPIRKEAFEIDLAPGEVHREPITGAGLVGGSGTGVIAGVLRPDVTESDHGETVIEPGDAFLPLASVVFWDRDFYRINFLWPRRAQYLSVVFALVSVALAGAIVWLSLA